jgi:glucose 1-dehydrogenase
VSFEQCDVSLQNDISDVVARSTRAHGPATVLVNNAGVHQAQDFFEITARDFRRILATNVDSAFNFTQAVARTLVDASIGGSIINLSSVNSRMASPTAVAYASSKGAISALTAATSLALATHGIRVNAIAPGTIDTDLTARAQSDPAQLETILQRTPLGRLGRPDEIASVAAFLASSDASYVTGQTIFVEGGRMALSFSMPVESD